MGALVVIAVGSIMLALIMAAVRIIIGWTMPATAGQRFDRAVRAGGGIIVKLWILALAGLLIAAMVGAWWHST
ncbi:hypothetical protein XI06_15285 [Bradyrhizobium sp. CCBAU 11434]|uniref:hypothetical protein n=1 Tax=Bradyrhizobium sp. CCBAU 11434 TaxID=1630885 RepID=UPI002304F811|nr:hypothetical protein [Bradyrhizobium sp. CCBAU 11434]MDA9521667.1 hypothetical protein [Bradyrhizobium sp. CCBAU 11434]